MEKISDRVFLDRPIHTSNPRRHHHSWRQAGTFSKFVPLNTRKCTPWACLALDFFKHFPNYLSLHCEALVLVDDL